MHIVTMKNHGLVLVCLLAALTSTGCANLSEEDRRMLSMAQQHAKTAEDAASRAQAAQRQAQTAAERAENAASRAEQMSDRTENLFNQMQRK